MFYIHARQCLLLGTLSSACKMVLWLAVLAMPVAISSTTLLYIVGPVVLFALLFFNLTFIALGSNYIPTEELLDKEEENNGSASAKYMRSGGGSPKTSACNSEILQSEGLAAVSCPISRIIAPFLGHSNSHISNDTYKLKVEKLKTDVFGRPGGASSGSCNKNKASDVGTESLQHISEERRIFIQNSLDQWCVDLGYKDCNVNMLTLSRTLCISKNELSQFFDKCLHTNFRIWLSEIRFNAAKKMMQDYPDYSNDIISAECGFSCRTHLYRIFKNKEGCSPTEWRGRNI